LPLSKALALLRKPKKACEIPKGRYRFFKNIKSLLEGDFKKVVISLSAKK